MESEKRSRRIRLISVILTLAIIIGVFPIKHVKADTGSTTENDLTVTYHTVSAWGGFTQAEVTVENKGNTTTDGWRIEFEYDDTTTISSIWNAIAAPSDISSPEKNNVDFQGILGHFTMGLISGAVGVLAGTAFQFFLGSEGILVALIFLFLFLLHAICGYIVGYYGDQEYLSDYGYGFGNSVVGGLLSSFIPFSYSSLPLSFVIATIPDLFIGPNRLFK